MASGDRTHAQFRCGYSVLHRCQHSKICGSETLASDTGAQWAEVLTAGVSHTGNDEKTVCTSAKPPGAERARRVTRVVPLHGIGRLGSGHGVAGSGASHRVGGPFCNIQGRTTFGPSGLQKSSIMGEQSGGKDSTVACVSAVSGPRTIRIRAGRRSSAHCYLAYRRGTRVNVSIVEVDPGLSILEQVH